MRAIFKREVKSYFQNVVGWLFIAAVLAVFGLYFYAYNLRSGYPYIYYAFSAVTMLLLIAVPILTMRSFSEEQKNRTDQLMLTSPVSVGQIVLGKYLAMLFVYSVDIAVFAVMPPVLSRFGSVPMGESYIALLGFWLYGAACIAVGMYISSITESQVIAAVLTFVALFLSYMMSGICSLISVDGNLLTKVLGYLDLYTTFERFTGGMLDLTAILYYLSVIFLFAFLTVQKIQKRRYQVTRKKLSLGVFSTTMTAVGLAVVIVANLLVNALPVTMTSIDCTDAKLYSVTQETKTFLKELDEDVTIYVLEAESSKDETIDGTLSRYRDLSDHVTIKYMSPATYPYFYQDYTQSAPTKNSLIVVGASGRSKVLDYNELYVYDYSFDYTTYSYNSELVGYDAEGQITSALEYVTMAQEELPVVYVIGGHNELSVGTSIQEVFEKANVILEDLELFNEEQVPENASAIIINAPQADYNSADAQKVIDYLEKGGRAIIAESYNNADFVNFNSILEAYGATLIKGVVAEQNSSYYYGQETYLLPEVQESDYTTDIVGAYTFAPVSVAFDYEAQDGITYIPMLSTTADAVVKTDLANMKSYKYEEGDRQGAFDIAFALEKTLGDTTTKLVVLGSPYLLSDEANTTVSGNHAHMMSNIIAQLMDEISLSTSVIPTKNYSLSNLMIPAKTSFILGIVVMILIPVMLLAGGIVYWARRRRR